MTEKRKRGGPGRGLPAPRSGSTSAARLGAEELRRIIDEARSDRPDDVVVTGWLQHADIESGPLVLLAVDGTQWELLLPAGWEIEAQPGARVTIKGQRADDVETTAQVGPRLRVTSLSRAD
jgi:hypothetical protein